jgi:ABC-2 type transport system ATP-binding protein
MEEAQRLADQVGVLAAGRLVATGPPEELAGSSPAEAEVAFHLPAGVGAGELPLPHDAELARSNGSVVFHTPTPTRDLAPLLSWAAERGIELDGLAVGRATLEDAYLELTANGHGEPE